jgi:pimeloyl-ACP methyl ester carboxylesterase
MKSIIARTMMCVALLAMLNVPPARAAASPPADFGAPPQGFTSGVVSADGTNLHYVRGGKGPPLILVHGFPESWVEYRDVMPRLAGRFTVIAVDLPGIGKSTPSKSGYEAATLARTLHSMVTELKLNGAYLVGHDLGGIVTYAYVRQFPESLRGAMILDVPMPGIAGWDEAVAGTWHIGFIQVPGLAEKLVTGRQEAFLGWALDVAKFSTEQRAYYFRDYGSPQLHAAFEIYRGFPADGKWNAAQSGHNAVPLTVVVGDKSFFASYLPKFMEGYRAQGMANVQDAHVPESSHYVLADNPQAVGDLIERYGSGR